MIIPVTRVLNQEVIEKDMKSGVLYHLRYTYPVIDGIACLKVEGTSTIMFIQISTSEYQRHGTKLFDLFNEAPENPRKSILHHCLTSYNSVEIRYVDVSPHSTTK